MDKMDLALYIDEFYENKQKADDYKKVADNQNKNIKKAFTELNLTEIETDTGLVAKLTTQNRENFNEPSLIKYLKANDFSDAIDMVEVINYDKLEDMIYNGKMNASKLAEFKETKQIQVLKVSKKK